jgi:hypothetical protein
MPQAETEEETGKAPVDCDKDMACLRGQEDFPLCQVEKPIADLLFVTAICVSSETAPTAPARCEENSTSVTRSSPHIERNYRTSGGLACKPLQMSALAVRALPRERARIQGLSLLTSCPPSGSFRGRRVQ